MSSDSGYTPGSQRRRLRPPVSHRGGYVYCLGAPRCVSWYIEEKACTHRSQYKKNNCIESQINVSVLTRDICQTMEFRIEHQWNSAPVAHEPVTIWLKSVDGGLRMDVSAPFFNDPPAPPGAAGQPLSGLWDYEVVEAFFLNSNTEQYLEVEVCPHGQHLVLLLSQRRNIWKESLPLSLQVSRTDTTWNGCALLPWDYFPPSVDKFNAYAIHGSELERTYEALYPVPQHAVQEGQQPDFHRLEYFRPFSFSAVMGEKWKQPESSLWKM